MEKWEYLIEFLPGSMPGARITVKIQLNKLGEQGWELICKEGDTYFFKRRKA